MRHILWAIVLISLIAGASLAGLSIAQPSNRQSEANRQTVENELASFMPWHVNGPHEGKRACPLCVYGHRPAAAIWTSLEGLKEAAVIAASLDRVIAELPPQSTVGYVVLLPDSGTPRSQSQAELQAAFRDVPLKQVFLTIAEPDENKEDVDVYKKAIRPGDRTTTFVYANRRDPRVHSNLSEPYSTLKPALAKLLEAEEPGMEIAVPMCGKDEPGERLDFYGRVFDEGGRPLAKASIIAYNTGADGLYVPRGSNHRNPRIRGVAITDSGGWYRFSTNKPGGYPGSKDPSHIHLHADAAMHQHTYVTFWFEGDPRLDAAMLARRDKETVVVRLRKRDDGVWTFRHDIRLGGG